MCRGMGTQWHSVGTPVNRQMPTARQIRATVPDVSDNAVRKQISREVKRALVDARISARAAALRMEVEPKTVYRWINEEVTAPLDALALFAEKVGPIRLDITKDGLPSEDDRPLTKADVIGVIDALARSGYLDATARALLDAVLAGLGRPPRVVQAPGTPRN